MTCEPELLSAFLDGEVSPDERRTVEAHLDACPDCRALLDELRQLGAVLRREDAPGASPELVARIVASVPPAPDPRLSSFLGRALTWRLTVPVPTLALGLALVGLAAWLSLGGREAPTVDARRSLPPNAYGLVTAAPSADQARLLLVEYETGRWPRGEPGGAPAAEVPLPAPPPPPAFRPRGRLLVDEEVLTPPRWRTNPERSY